LAIKEKEAARRAIPSINEVKGALANDVLSGRDIGDTGKQLLGLTKTPAIKSVDRGDVVDIYENGVKVRTEQKGQAPGTVPKPEKPKEPKEEKSHSADLKRLGDMVAVATQSGEPKANDITIINEMAGKLGYEFVNVKGTKPGMIYGTNETSEWKLVPKASAGSAVKPPEGFVASGKTSGGKRVYTKGKQAWIAP
jgi:hypothetical protein